MDWFALIGGISGIIALLGLAFGFGRYATKIDDIHRMKDRLLDTCIRTDSLWGMKDDLSAVVVKVDTMWKVYIEDTLVRHSNPGGHITLPEELKADIKDMLNNDKYLQQVSEPTLLVIHKIGLERFSEVAKGNQASLGEVLAEANTFVFTCLSETT